MTAADLAYSIAIHTAVACERVGKVGMSQLEQRRHRIQVIRVVVCHRFTDSSLLHRYCIVIVNKGGPVPVSGGFRQLEHVDRLEQLPRELHQVGRLVRLQFDLGVGFLGTLLRLLGLGAQNLAELSLHH